MKRPFGLVAATESGPLTQNLAIGQLQLWNGATGRPKPIKLTPSANFVAAGRDRVVWQSDSPFSALHVIELDTGTDIAVSLPQAWEVPSETYPPPPASFDPSGRRLILTLDRVGYYQLGFWTGAGPLHTSAPAYGSPTALSAPGSG